MNDAGPVTPREPIAIVGIGCRLPGGADTPERFWQLLSGGVDTTSDIPPDRWNLDAYYDPTGKRPGSIMANRGAFLPRLDGFDPAFFGISPREATRMDPQQRLLLEVAWEALDDAGLKPASLAGSPVGVFVGISWNDYSTMQLASGMLDAVDAHTGAGGAISISANRISHAFDFRGPSMAVDTACSSALVATHLACHALWNGECHIALAGGVNAMIIPGYFVALTRLAMLSVVGQCRAFDADGKGYVRGEGAGLVALRPLADAQRAGDRIYAVIRGTAVNQDGHTPGITMPSQAAQEVVVRQALARAGAEPRDIQYVEAHGTGTPAGDPIEARALGSVIGAGRNGDACVLGSVKTNIGHLESAAGIAGLIKATLALSNRQFPPNLHFRTPHPDIPFKELGLRVATALEPWPRHAKPRAAGVNSFGFGGTNAHVILGEAPAETPATPAAGGVSGAQLLPLSARGAAALRDLVAEHVLQLQDLNGDGTAFASLCRTAATRRDHLETRLAAVATSAGELRERLETWLAGESAPGLTVGRAAATEPGVVFAFCGQGAQWWGMARSLLETDPSFRATIERIDALLRRDASWSLLEELRRDDATTRVHQTDILQPAVFAVQVALCERWRAWGITPSAVVGHSMGEIAAAWAAGLLTLEDATRLIYHRARVQHRAAGTGKMLAVGLSPEAAEAEIVPYAGRLWIAGRNGPSSTTIGGETAAVAELAAALTARSVFNRVVRMEMACHTPHMDPLERELFEALGSVPMAQPTIPFYSTVLGRRVTESLDVGYWWDNLRQPVNFLAAAEALAADGFACAIDIGPHPVLASGLVEVFSRGATALVVPSLRREADDRTTLLGSLGALFTAGCDVDWAAVTGVGGPPARLPNYPWQRQSYWNESPRALADRLGTNRRPLLGSRQPGPHGCWETTLDGARYPFLAHHVVQETVVVPGAALGVLSLIAGEADLPGEGPVVVEELEFHKALFIPAEAAQTVQLTLRTDGGLEIHSRPEGGDGPWTRHATARVRREAASAPQRDDLAAIRARCPRPVEPAALYQGLHDRGIHLGASFQGVTEAWGGELEALARMTAPADIAGDVDVFPLHPALLDCCLQIIIAALPKESTGMYLPVEMGRLRLHARPGGSFLAHIRLRDVNDRTADADVRLYDEAGLLLGEATGCRVRAVHETSASAEAGDNLLYQFEWQLAAPLRGGGPADFFTEPAELMAQAQGAFAAVASADGVHYDEYYDRAQGPFETLARRYVESAMVRLGWNWNPGDALDPDDAARRLRVIPRHARLFARMLGMLAEDGVLARQGSGYQVVRAPLDEAPGALLDEATTAFLWLAPERTLFTRCAAGLADVLRGDTDPLQLVFPEGRLAEVEHLNQDFPVLHAYNAAAARIVAQLVERLPKGRTLRVLEVGAGTGALTSHVLKALPKDRTDYVHTDISPLFGREAKAKFSAFPFVRYEMLDVERDPADQGFAPGSVDLVLAGNVLHATRDLSAVLAHVRGLLAPGGMALVLEGTRMPRWIELVFGLTDGWWRFADTLRTDPTTPMLSTGQWTAAFQAAGFESASAFTDPRRAGQPGHAVYAARVGLTADPVAAAVPSADGRHWLVLADRGGVMRNVAARLGERGARCTVIERPDALDGPAIAAVVAEAGGVAPVDEVLFGWSLDAIVDENTSAAALADAQRLVSEAVLHLTHALLPSGDAVPRLSLVTAQAQPTGGEAVAVAQAPLWGFGRVLMAEHKDLRVRLFDVAAAGAFDHDAFVDELLAGSEEEIALRGSQRYVHRLMARPELRAATGGIGRTGGAPFALRVATPGVLDTLEYRATSRRAPGPGEVEVEVHVAGLNFKDVMLAMNMLPDDAVEASYSGGSLGKEFAGRVVAVGANVTNVKVGDEVLGLGTGAFGGYVTTVWQGVVRRPPNLSPEAAAAVPLAHVTAHYALNQLARMQRGERVLIHSASGGVGLAAIQLARRAGAEIFATAGTEEKRAYLRSLGIAHVLDSRTVAFAEEILRVTGGQGVDIVLNTLSGEGFEKSLSVLRDNGRFVDIGRRDVWQNTRIGLRHFVRNLMLTSIDLDRASKEMPDLVHQAFREAVDALADGSIAPPLYTNYEPADIGAAFRTMAQGKHIGKLIVDYRGRDVPLAAQVTETPVVREDGTYLLTGGLGGFGLVVAEWLVQGGARHLVLLGRSGAATDDAREAVARMEAAGAVVRVIKVDVTREDDLAGALADVRATMPPLRGVLHGAMVLDDAYIVQMDAAQFRRVMAPKADGAWNLHRLTKADPLDWFVTFSSGAAVFGNLAQANYCAANAFLGALAHHRRTLGLPALTVCWGALGGAGYVAKRERLEQYLANQGYPPLFPAEACAALGALMRQDVPEAGVIRVDWSRWRTAFSATLANSARFSGVSRSAAVTGGAGGGTEARKGRSAFLAAPAGERDALLAAAVAGHLARVLGTAAESLDRDRKLNDLGLDSLMAVELRNRLDRDFGVDMPVMTLLQGPTVVGLARLIGQALLADGSPEGAAPLATAAPAPASKPAAARAPVASPAPRAPAPRVVPAAAAAAAVVAPMVTPHGNGHAKTSWARRNGPAICAGALRLAGARFEFDGLDRIPKTGPMVLVCNHVNGLDAVLMFSFVKRRMSSFVKDSLRHQPVVGWFVSEMLDAIYVTRGTGDQEALGRAIALVNGGGALTINPEGTRSHDGVLRKGQPGAAFIAAQTGAPIVPAVMYGHEALTHNMRRLRRTTVHIKVGEPLALPAANTAEEIGRNTERLMVAMARMLPAAYRGAYASQVTEPSA